MIISLLKVIPDTRRFVRGFVIAFSVQVIISIILSIGSYYARQSGYTTCFACENTKVIWNSPGIYVSSHVEDFSCPYELHSQFVHVIALSISLLLSYLTTPLCIGLLVGFAYSNEKKFKVRLFCAFFLLYAPIWFSTTLYLLNRYIFGYSTSC